MRDNELKCSFSEDEMKKNIKKALNILDEYRCYHSSNIVLYYNNKRWNSEWICSVFLFDNLKQTIEKLKSSYLKIKIYDTIYESDKAFFEIKNFILSRYLNNMISTLLEKIRCDELEFSFNENRFSYYDYSSKDNVKIDQKDIKIKNTTDFKYDYEALRQGDSNELKKIAIHFIKNQKNNEISDMCNNIHYNVYVDRDDDMMKLLNLQIDFDSYRAFNRGLALCNTTSAYAFDIGIQGYTFHITMNVFFTE